MRTVACLFAAVTALGCAEGSDGIDPDGGFGGDGGAAPSGASSGSATSSASTSGSSASTSATASSSSGGMCNYDSPNTCQAATIMAEISGDAGTPMQVQHGNTSEWLAIRVVETQYDPIEGDEEPFSYKVTLQSPAGMDFDVFVQLGPNDGGAVCNAATAQGMGSGGIETISGSWSDNISFGDDQDDHRWLSIEVRYVSGTACGADAEWTLTVTRV